MSSQKNIKYRADIDGLRALAILSVVFYHAYPSLLKGGFVGVDVFFVISGFLISSIIIENIDSGKFSLLDFYSRRVKRIFPALLAVLVFCIVFGWFALLDFEYKQLGKHIVAAVGFFSNLVYWKEAGYFDVSAETKPLLHLWSLGIEEQFYIFWPLLLWVSSRLKLKRLTLCSLLIFFSFFHSIDRLHVDPIEAFYSPLPRVWELLAGALIASLFYEKSVVIVQSRNKKDLLSFIGLGLILLSITVISNEKPFPGWYALLPVSGTALIIMSGKDAFLNERILSNKHIVFIGLISYPLYLWHWSLMSFNQILAGEVPSVLSRLVIIFLSFFLAYTTYKFIEIPIRQRTNSVKLIISLLVIFFLVGLLGYYVEIKDGLPSRKVVTENVNAKDIFTELYSSRENCVDARVLDDVKPACTFYPASTLEAKTIVIWGDSSASAWAPVFLKLGYEMNFNIFLISHPGCPPLLNVRKTRFMSPEAKLFCGNSNLGKDILRSISNIHPALTFYIAYWNIFNPLSTLRKSLDRDFITNLADGEADKYTTEKAIRDELPKTIKELEKESKVVIFRPWVTLDSAPNYNIKRIQFLQATTEKRASALYADHIKESQYINSIFDQVQLENSIFFDPAKIYCHKICDSIVDGRKMFADTYHITAQGSAFFLPEIKSMLVDFGHITTNFSSK